MSLRTDLVGDVVDRDVMHGRCVALEQSVKVSPTVPLAGGALTVGVDWLQVFGVLLLFDLQGSPGHQGGAKPLRGEREKKPTVGNKAEINAGYVLITIK